MAFDVQSFLADAGDGKTVLVYKSGFTIFKQGDAAQYIYYLQEGSAKETVTSGGRKEAVIGMLEPGLFFGTGALVHDQKRRSAVTTVTACRITRFTRDIFIRALTEPEFAPLFTAYLLERNSRIEDEKVDLLLNSVEKRLALRLISLAHAKRGAPQIIGPQITQEMIAEMVGTTRPRVNYFMNRFRRLGFIDYSPGGGIVVLPTLLTVVVEQKSNGN